MKGARGFSLLEVLIAVLVLAIGLLGVAGLQAASIKTNHSALQRSQAVMLAYFMMDAMRANKAEAIAGRYNMGGTPTACPAPSETDLVTRDQKVWLDALRDDLGAACGSISCDATGCTVRVLWDDSRAGGSSSEVIEVTSQL